MTKELVVLHSPGWLPGIPGESHGPGVFLVDYEARTIEPYVPDEEQALSAPGEQEAEQEQPVAQDVLSSEQVTPENVPPSEPSQEGQAG